MNRALSVCRAQAVLKLSTSNHRSVTCSTSSQQPPAANNNPPLGGNVDVRRQQHVPSGRMRSNSRNLTRIRALILREMPTQRSQQFDESRSRQNSPKRGLAKMQGHGRQTLDSLYPQARKLQFELKMQMSYLDSGRTGGKTDAELQAEARGNLSTLEQLLWQLDSLVQTSAKPAERDTWTKRLQQLRSETHALGSTLEQHIYSVNRRAVEARERESLMSRRNAGFDSGNGAMYAAQESESLQRSSQMVSDLTSLSQSILGDLGEQRNRMKNVRTKLLDIANRLGLSSSLLRVIERRDTVDFWIVIGGMIFTLVFLYVCYSYATQS